MTLTAPVTTATHPLSRLSAEEFTAIRSIVTEAGLVGEQTKFVYVGLDEPHKSVVLAWSPGDPIERKARVLLLDRATGNGADLTVSITAGTVESNTPIDALVDGQVPILDGEFEAIEPILAADERWVAAMAKRGLDVANVRSVPLSAGSYFPDEFGSRVVRVLGFHQADPEDLPWAHPVDGVVAFVDVTRGVALDVQDHFDLPVPAERADLTPDVVRDLKPIQITQPEGRSFTVEDDVIRWAGWEVRVGFDAREGLTLNQVSIDGRSVVHRASIAEMVVPYADPSPVRFWQNYFDTGEYLFARYTNSLELGCDCLGEIHYFDGVLSDEGGNPRTIKNAICLHEEDYGVAWKHTDMFNGMLETRRSRRLVISFFTTIGNYDYGFYWYLYTDGTIQLESKATGIVFTSAYRGEEHPYATEIAPGLGAPFHQHLFSARLDMAVDGVANTVHEVDAVRVPISETNPYGNAFTRKLTPLTTEKDAARLTDATVGRTWHIVNPGKTNRLGQPVGYALHPEASPVLLADESSSVAARATFSTKSLWVTAYDPAERYPAGDFVNQHPGDGGLPAFIADDAPVENTDVVLWHTFGLTHFPRPEDWPVMPTDYSGFTLKPVGFFDKNPALGVPKSTSSHCAAAEGHCS
ncbi:primary-amine oxidase [Modestobacter sp. VKM Ac-2984]|uniref:primary-amine oxidase n=1 Tax=Modestobacter sp. VKM Ac-2984 TaxID=3004138 RepID=UPI0022AA1ED9|nr:primary-amine oxidase [Modestobacter sp. VKM Ac-2984]MCZ2817925.1 primary-amine oxidase [Modestobacter sp. VKM Ac-2984]